METSPTFVSNAPELVVNALGLVATANAAASRLFGLTCGLKGKRLSNLSIREACEQDYRALDWVLLFKLLIERAKHAEAVFSPSERGLFSPSEHESIGRNASTDFWEGERRLAPKSILNVVVERFSDSAGSTQLVRAQMTMTAWELNDYWYFGLAFAASGSRSRTSPSNHVVPGMSSPDERSRKSVSQLSTDAFQLICNRIPHILTSVDAETGGVDYISQQFMDYTGMSESESLGWGWRNAVHPEDLDGMITGWANALMAGSNSEFEARYKRNDGSYRWMSVVAQPWKDDDGKVIKWYGSVTDVHDLVIARNEADRVKRQIMTILSHADITLWGVTPDWESYSISLGNKLKDAKNGPASEDIRSALKPVLEGTTPFAVMEHSYMGRWFRTRFVADMDIEDQQNGAKHSAGALGLSVDITDLRARAELELENERLIAQEQSARDTTHLKSQFLANMSHEIRTPIAGIIGLSGLLVDSSLDEEQRELTQGIQQSAVFLLTVVNDILDFSKIESGHMDIESIAFNPSEVLNELFKFMKYQAAEKGLTLEYQSAYPQDQHIIGDPGRLRQVLTNLLSNSLKFQRKGIVRLSLNVLENPTESLRRTLHRIASQNGDRREALSLPVVDENSARLGQSETLYLCFTVEDQGIGIEEKVLRTLFQAFHQADPSTARLYGGTGLGLSITKQLVGLMGGEIKMESALGRGTKATVTIPFRVATGDGAITASTIPSPSLTPRATFGGTTTPISRRESLSQITRSGRSSVRALSPERTGRGETHVLVVEDNAINQKVALKTLKKLGFPASAAWNGQEALEYLERAPSASHPMPHVILMDCMMPKLDGYQATQAIRNSTSFSTRIKTIPIIALTASAIQGDKDRCKESGMDDYLAKPIVAGHLERMLLKWTSQAYGPADG